MGINRPEVEAVLVDIFVLAAKKSNGLYTNFNDEHSHVCRPRLYLYINFGVLTPKGLHLTA